MPWGRRVFRPAIAVFNLLLLGAFLSGSTAQAEDEAQGSLSFSQSSFDFGAVHRGQQLSHRFTFTNAGKGPLTIQGVHAACGCTAVETDKGRRYLPGEQGVVEVKLDTTDFAGTLQKAVVVMSSERLSPDRTLTLKAFVKSEIEAEPPLVDFGEVIAKDGASQVVRIKPVGGFRLALRDLEYNPAVFDLKSAPDKDGAFLLTVRLKPGLAPGFLKERIVVRNNSVHLAEMPLPVRAHIKGHIEMTPQYVEFGAIAPQDKARRSISLRGANAFEITGTRAELTVNGRRLEGGDKFVSIQPQAPSEAEKQVAVELSNQGGVGGSVHGKLFFQTSDPVQRELAVDFYAFFR